VVIVIFSLVAGVSLKMHCAISHEKKDRNRERNLEFMKADLEWIGGALMSWKPRRFKKWPSSSFRPLSDESSLPIIGAGAESLDHAARLALGRSPVMKLLNTYDDSDEAEAAKNKLQGERRLASERDSTVVIYNLFGLPTWGNFHRLEMYNLSELSTLLARRDSWNTEEQARHGEIVSTLRVVSKNYRIAIPSHWL
jgi:hypothetical protein